MTGFEATDATGENAPLTPEEEEVWRRQGERLEREHELIEPTG